MKTITKKYNVYTIEELKQVDKIRYEREIEDIKEQVIDDNFYFLKEDMLIILSEDYGIQCCDIGYSLSYCQGDGVCFYNYSPLSYRRLKNRENLNAFEKYIFENYCDNAIDMIIKYLNCGYSLKIVKNSHNHLHAYTCDIDYEYFTSDNDIEEADINNLIDSLSKDLFINVYLKICGVLEKRGYACYDVSDEDCIDFAENNDLEFEVEIYG